MTQLSPKIHQPVTMATLIDWFNQMEATAPELREQAWQMMPGLHAVTQHFVDRVGIAHVFGSFTKLVIVHNSGAQLTSWLIQPSGDKNTPLYLLGSPDNMRMLYGLANVTPKIVNYGGATVHHVTYGTVAKLLGTFMPRNEPIHEPT